MSIFDESIIKYVQNVSSELRNRFVEIFRSCWALPYTKWMLTKWTKCECVLCMQRVFSIWIIAAWKRCANSQSFKKQHFSGGNTIKPTWTHVKCVILWINYRFHRNVYSLLTQRKPNCPIFGGIWHQVAFDHFCRNFSDYSCENNRFPMSV